jgi:N6-L-threonylcarbamoyladenine synthase
VAANARLREKLAARAADEGCELVIPRPELCTDNAAMVAALSAVYLEAGRDDGLMLDADAGLPWPTE